jgi:predicted RNA-binding protein with PIN domain
MSAEFHQSVVISHQLYAEVKQIHKNLQKLLENIKKSTNRKFTTASLEEKIIFANNEKLQFDKLIKEINLQFRISEKFAEKLSQI